MSTDGYVDLSGADEGARRKLAPNGVYDAEIRDVEHKVGKTSGEPYYNWVLKLIDDDYSGVTIYFVTSFTDNAIGNGSIQNIEKMAGVRLPRGRFHPETWLAENRERLIGRTVTIQVKTEHSDGYEDKNAVANVRMPLPTGTTPAEAAPAATGKKGKTTALFE